MRKQVLYLLAICVVATVVFAKAPAKQPVTKVTKVVATMHTNIVSTAAEGEVPTTGWSKGELVPEATRLLDTLVYRFVARPPTKVFNPLVSPIKASKKTGPLLPPFPTKVRVIAGTNDMVVDIVKK